MRLLIALVLLLSAAAAQAVDINLIAIMGDKALMEVDGSKGKLFSPGQSAGSAKVLAVSSAGVVLDIGGQKKTLTLDNRALRNNPSEEAKTSKGPRKITLFAEHGHFYADITINGMPFRGMIDTGATMLALSGVQANQASVDPKSGTVGYVSTANGIAPVYKVSVGEVKLSGVTLYNVETVISEGNSPREPLIGMSILNRFTMERDGDRLVLTQRY